jgi:hypothetical protein
MILVLQYISKNLKITLQRGMILLLYPGAKYNTYPNLFRATKQNGIWNKWTKIATHPRLFGVLTYIGYYIQWDNCLKIERYNFLAGVANGIEGACLLSKNENRLS